MPYINIHIMSFEDAAIYSRLVDIPPTIIISIEDKGWTPTPLDIDNPAVLDAIKLYINDTEEPTASYAMNEHDANRIVAFVKKYLPMRPEILVHCAGGISRSAGVAAALGRWLNGNDEFVMSSPYRRPNFLCYTRILDAAGIHYDYSQEKERFAQQHSFSHAWNEIEHIELDKKTLAEIKPYEKELTLTQEQIEEMEIGWDDITERLKQRSWKHAKAEEAMNWIL